MLTYWEILTAIQSNVPVSDSYAQLWGRKSQGGYTVATYTGTLPATLTGTNAGYLHRYKIYGNTEQTGTPTPENPIVPQECGEKTENLLDRKNSVKGKFLGLQGDEGTQSSFSYTDFLKINASAPYTIMSYDTPLGGAAAICFYDADLNFIYGIVYANRYSINFTTETNIAYVRCSYKPTDRVSLSLGSTAPTSYIPYGYKLPLTSGSTPVDIYLGASQTTRWIKKLVLTGKENWQKSSRNLGSFYVYLYEVAPNAKSYSPILCTHVGNKSSPHQYGNGVIDNNSLSLWLFDEEVTSTRFKSFLAAQYANGTPVTVWYVLATEETGTLNEPLRKINGYADTIDSTQTTAQIPTSAGSTTISWAGEGLAPSKVELEYEKKR